MAGKSALPRGACADLDDVSISLPAREKLWPGWSEWFRKDGFAEMYLRSGSAQQQGSVGA